MESESGSAHFTVLATLREDARSGLYRAVRRQDGRPVILERLHAEMADARELGRLRHELGVGRSLESPFVLRPLELETRDARVSLVFEDFDGALLSNELSRPLSIDRFFSIAQRLAEALADLHRHGLVHNGLKPASILVSHETDELKLLDLGDANPIAHSPLFTLGAQVTEKDPAYMSPEQTGRMNRGVDHRSDLYSLGLVYYSLLTGALPFQASDPLEWVHSHIAQPPRSPTAVVPAIPEVLAQLVLKLLAKQADQRYQSAGGVKADLERCAAEWRAHRHVEPFLLGSRDVVDRLTFPGRLYGRQPELRALAAALERVVGSGEPELILVGGYSGIGKSALVSEFRRGSLPRGALFAAAKSDQKQRDIRHVLGQSDEALAGWRGALQEALGPNGRLVTNLVPELALVIGEQPAVQEVPLPDAQARFNTVFRRLLGAFARPGCPLVLFLDDLQWLDAATLELVEHLFTRPAVQHVLLLGGYRDNEVGPLHPLTEALSSLRRAGATTRSITLGPLAEGEVLRFVADVLCRPDDDAAPLAKLVQAKTGGNPFFIIHFLTALAEEGLLTFDGATTGWRWDLERIRGKGLTDNVADLMVAKLSRLSGSTQASLKTFACLGSKARLATLAAALGRPELEVEDGLLEAIQAGLLVRQEDRVAFLHDRVMEAAYSLIPEGERPAVHLEIGRRLLAQAEPGRLDDVLFDVIAHLNRGATSMTDPAERARLAELDAAAGRRARASIAYAAARDLFATAVGLLPEEAWRARYDFTFGLHLDLAEAHYFVGAWAEGDVLLDAVLARAQGPLDRARVYGLKLTAYPMAGRFDEAVAMGVKALQLLGETIPETEEGLQEAIAAEARAVDGHLRGHAIPELAELPEATDPNVKVITHLLTAMGGPAYIGSRPQLFPLLGLKNLNYLLRCGATKDGTAACSGYAHLLMSGLGDPRDGFEFSLVAMKLAERFREPGVLVDALYMHGNHVNFWLEPIATDFPFLERGFRLSLDTGNLPFGNYIAYSIVWQAVERGDALDEALELSQKYAAFALGSGNAAIHQTIVLEQQFLKCLMGRTSGPQSFDGDGVSEAACLEQITRASFTCGVAYYHTMKTLVASLMGDDAAARRHAKEARCVLSAVAAQPMEATFSFLCALVLLRWGRDAGDEEERALGLRRHTRRSSPRGPSAVRRTLPRSTCSSRRWPRSATGTSSRPSGSSRAPPRPPARAASSIGRPWPMRPPPVATSAAVSSRPRAPTGARRGGRTRGGGRPPRWRSSRPRARGSWRRRTPSGARARRAWTSST